MRQRGTPERDVIAFNLVIQVQMISLLPLSLALNTPRSFRLTQFNPILTMESFPSNRLDDSFPPLLFVYYQNLLVWRAACNTALKVLVFRKRSFYQPQKCHNNNNKLY